MEQKVITNPFFANSHAEGDETPLRAGNYSAWQWGLLSCFLRAAKQKGNTKPRLKRPGLVLLGQYCSAWCLWDRSSATRQLLFIKSNLVWINYSKEKIRYCRFFFNLYLLQRWTTHLPIKPGLHPDSFNSDGWKIDYLSITDLLLITTRSSTAEPPSYFEGDGGEKKAT